VENAGHHLIGGHEVVGVEGVNDTLLGLAERAGAGYAAHNEETKVVGVDGRGAINQLACFIIFVECLPEEADIVSQGLTRAVSEHEVVQQGEREREGHAVQSFT
jgi:hypothetical protein